MPCCRRKELVANCLYTCYLSCQPAVTYKLHDIQTQNKGAVYLNPLKSQAHRERLYFPRRLGKNMRFINVLSGSTLIPTIPGGNSIEKNPTNPVNPVTFYKMVHFQKKKTDWNNNIGKSSSYWSCFHCFPKKWTITFLQFVFFDDVRNIINRSHIELILKCS